MQSVTKMKFGVLTVSDTCYQGTNIDKSGPTLIELIKIYFSHGYISESLVPDDIDQIKKILIEWSDNDYDVIFTTGGTGLAPRDVTPEATKAVIEKEVPGIMYALYKNSLKITPYAMLTRAVAGIRKKTLIINFPGSVKAVKENFEIIYKILPHAVSLIKDEKVDVRDHHKQIQQNTEIIEPSKVKVNCVAGRDRQSKYEMIEVSEALDLITTYCGKTSDTEYVASSEALGRVLAEDVQSLEPLPAFPASIKDGYAVRASDGDGERNVCDVKAAGDNPSISELQSGYCVRISTGAPVPPGADAVVQVEDTELVEANDDMSQEIKINILKCPTVGQDIRQVGSDMAAFAVVLTKGSVLNVPEIGILAAIGKTKVKVFSRPTIGVISTGNEIQGAGESLQSGKIRDSNKISLINLLKQYSYLAEDCGVARDNPTNVKQVLSKAFDKCDFVITSGGVSMGEFDLIKEVLVQDFNGTIHFGRINMKPGKPTTFATCLYKGQIKTIFALPGNPVSALVTSFLFVIPALRYRENRNNYQHTVINVFTESYTYGDKERPDYQRVMLKYSEGTNCTYAETTGNQISSRLNSLAGSDGLMLIPPNTQHTGPYLCYLLKKY